MILLNKNEYSIQAINFKRIEFVAKLYLIELHPDKKEEGYFYCDFLVKIDKNGLMQEFHYTDKLSSNETSIKDIRINYVLFDVFYMAKQGRLPFEAYCPAIFLEDKDLEEAHQLYADCKNISKKAHKLFNNKELEIVFHYFNKNKYNEFR